MTTELNKIDFTALRKDFPIFKETNRGRPLIYLDSAASAQKPREVVEAIAHFYFHDYANIHRGIYELSERATQLFENTRKQVQKFVRCLDADELIFVRGTTEAINLVAQTYGRSKWQAGDEVILSVVEHHSNIVPWYLLKEQIGIELKVIPINDAGTLDLEAYKKLFSPRTKLVAVSHVSNAIGIINPIDEMTDIAHSYDVPILVDGAQAIPHVPVDIQSLGCDFYTFSGHKLYGPTGIGVLYGRKELLARMPPYQGGGDMIETVAFDKVTYAKPPARFEAGTPDIAGVVGLSAAISYLQTIGMRNIFAHEQALLDYAENQLKDIPGLRLIGTARPKVGLISFVVEDMHAHDLGTVLDHEGIAVRAGHHCAMPLMERFNVPAMVRISFGLYNDEKDVDALVNAIHLAIRLFR